MRSIRNEFIASLLVVIVVSGLLAYGGNILLARQAVDAMVTQNDLEVARSLATSLADYYEQHGSWEGIRTEASKFRAGTRSGRDGREEAPLILTGPDGRLIYNGFSPSDHGKPVTYPSQYNTKLGQPIEVAGQTVGYVFFKSMVFQVYNPKEEQFLRSITTTLGVTLGLQTVIALLLGLVLASRFVRPITRLEAAVKRISEGSLHEHVEVVGRNEIASLSTHFNIMVDQLQAQETARQNLLADVAHELRTPVSILQANLEMMMDGVYPADRDRLASLHEETQLLTKLIGDLRTISDLELGLGAEPGEPLPLGDVVVEACQKHEARFVEAGIRLQTQLPDRPMVVRADTFRLAQVLGNLLDNALKYAPESKRVEVELSQMAQRVRVAVHDQGPGVPEAERGRLFDRFYRADRSRNRERGGRGLGLAICAQLVAAWGGTMGAENHHPGLTVWFELPLLAHAEAGKHPG